MIYSTSEYNGRKYGETNVDDRDPDLVLWQRAVQDARAFEQLRLKYRILVRSEMRRRVATLKEEDLQDLEQLVWIAVNHSLPSFRGQSRFSTWLVGTSKNVLFSWLRQQRTRPACENLDILFAATNQPDSTQETPIVHAIVLTEAVENLKSNERDVIQLRYQEQLTDEEIARRMEIPLGTVKSLIRSALKKLRQNEHLWQAFRKG